MGMNRGRARRAALLVGDVGATSTRLALAGPGARLRQVEVYPTPDGDLRFLLQAYVDRHLGSPPRGCALAAAGMVRGRADRARVALTNRATLLEAGPLARALGCPVLLCNDLVALAGAVPRLTPGRGLDYLDRVRAPGAGTRVVAAVGTGFGAAIITATGDILPTEAGHVQWPLDAPVREPVEARVSGLALSTRHPEYDSATALALAVDAGSAHARSVVDEFTRLLGCACANLVLGSGAWSGVYLAGGVMQALAGVLDGAALRAAFVDHRVFRSALARVPLVRISARHGTLAGLASLCAEAGIQSR